MTEASSVTAVVAPVAQIHDDSVVGVKYSTTLNKGVNGIVFGELTPVRKSGII